LNSGPFSKMAKTTAIYLARKGLDIQKPEQAATAVMPVQARSPTETAKIRFRLATGTATIRQDREEEASYQAFARSGAKMSHSEPPRTEPLLVAHLLPGARSGPPAPIRPTFPAVDHARAVLRAKTAS
jgi:hypothetical protein